MTSPDAGHPTRSLSYGWFAAIVIAYLAIIKGVGYVAGQIWNTDDGLYTTRDVIVQMWVPLGAALLFTYAVVAVLRWWDPVLRDRHPVQRWVWAVPIVFAVCIAAAIDYADLFDKSIGYILALLVATQFVGWGEEGMFRGIGVTTLRAHGLTEGRVALWSSIIFGAVHISNALTGDVSKALPQAIAVSFAGYFFYLIRRVSGATSSTPSSTGSSTSRSSPARPSSSTKALHRFGRRDRRLHRGRHAPHRPTPPHRAGRPTRIKLTGDHQPKKALPAEVEHIGGRNEEPADNHAPSRCTGRPQASALARAGLTVLRPRHTSHPSRTAGSARNPMK